MIFLAATKQLYEWFSLPVRLSVRPSVTPFSLCSHHCIIMKFSEVIINDRIEVYAKGQGQRTKVKATGVKTQISCFRTVTPVWIHIWWWNDAQSFTLHYPSFELLKQGHTYPGRTFLAFLDTVMVHPGGTRTASHYLTIIMMPVINIGFHAKSTPFIGRRCFISLIGIVTQCLTRLGVFSYHLAISGLTANPKCRTVINIQERD